MASISQQYYRRYGTARIAQQWYNEHVTRYHPEFAAWSLENAMGLRDHNVPSHTTNPIIRRITGRRPSECWNRALRAIAGPLIHPGNHCTIERTERKEKIPRTMRRTTRYRANSSISSCFHCKLSNIVYGQTSGIWLPKKLNQNPVKFVLNLPFEAHWLDFATAATRFRRELTRVAVTIAKREFEL